MGLARLPGVKQVHDLHVWTITSGMVAVAVHIVAVDGRRSRPPAARVPGSSSPNMTSPTRPSRSTATTTGCCRSTGPTARRADRPCASGGHGAVERAGGGDRRWCDGHEHRLSPGRGRGRPTCYCSSAASSRRARPAAPRAVCGRSSPIRSTCRSARAAWRRSRASGSDRGGRSICAGSATCFCSPATEDVAAFTAGVEMQNRLGVPSRMITPQEAQRAVAADQRRRCAGGGLLARRRPRHTRGGRPGLCRGRARRRRGPSTPAVRCNRSSLRGDRITAVVTDRGGRADRRGGVRRRRLVGRDRGDGGGAAAGDSGAPPDSPHRADRQPPEPTVR